MKILWITPIVLPAAARRLGLGTGGSGGWLGAMAPELVKANPHIHLSVLILHEGRQELTFEEDGIAYHVLHDNGSAFKDRSSIQGRLAPLISRIAPDVIDIQGVEFHYAKYIPSISGGAAVVATLQGLTSEIHRHYCGGLPVSAMLRFRTLKDNLLGDGILERKRKYALRGHSEILALKQVSYAIGRTYWDRSVSRAINPQIRYFHSQRNLRPRFFERAWSLASAEKHSIFISQAHAPFKGLHVLLHAASQLRPEFPSLNIYIAGRSILDRSSLKKRLAFGGYQKYLLHLIETLGLVNRVQFTGPLEADAMADRMVRSHVFVLPSFIENSPNSLAEAQVMGVPSVAAHVGGVPDMIEHGSTGFTYNPYDGAVLANLLRDVFLHDDLAAQLSRNSFACARRKYCSSEGGAALGAIYDAIRSDFLQARQGSTPP